jgi:biopolymer transport protein ExbD
MENSSNIINVLINKQGDISTDTVQLPDLRTLQEWLKNQVQQEPQLEVHIHVTELDSYEIVGKVIYQTQYAGVKTVKCFGGQFCD